MSDARASEERRTLGLPVVGAVPTAADAEQARRTVQALRRLRTQLTHTQGVLDDYLERLGEHAGDTRSTATGA